MKSSLILILTLFAISCTSVKVTKIDKNNYTFYQYGDNEYFRKAFYFYNYEEARIFAGTDSIKKNISDVLYHIVACNPDTAYQLAKSFSNIKHDTIDYYLGEFIDHYELFNFLKPPDKYWKNKVISNCNNEFSKPIFSFSNLSDTLDFENYFGLIIIKIKVNGNDCKFAWDTRSHTIISKNKKNNEKINDSCTYNVQTLNHKLVCQTRKMDSISIGQFNYYNISVAQTVGANSEIFDNTDIDGLIGWEIIKDFDNIIDFKNNKLILRKINPADYNNRHARNFFYSTYPTLEAYSTSGIPIFLWLDLGTNETYLHENYLKLSQINKDELGTKTYRYLTNSRAIDKEFKYVKKLDVIIQNKLVEFNQDISIHPNISSTFLIEGALGCDIFQDSKIHFNIASGIFEILD